MVGLGSLVLRVQSSGRGRPVGGRIRCSANGVAAGDAEGFAGDVAGFW